jgi:16S rRNA (guanine527-N7)-methyltransferase
MKTLEAYLEKGAEELGIIISPEQAEKFSKYADELCKWNRKINLTSIILPEEIAIKHFIDSLTLVKYVDVTGALLDIGSGGGFPGIPLKIMSPSTSIVSVDAVEKKILFQRHVVRTLALEGFTSLHCRAENLFPEYKAYFKTVVSRAFADLKEFVIYALPLLEEKGVIVAMKGREGRKEAEAARSELEKLGAAVSAVYEFELPLLKDLRSLIVISRMSL